jgi:23S rRNA (uracil1939-C5)-methyltransferase
MINRKITKTVNAHFTEEDATPATYKLAHSGIKFDLALLDPPRSGAKELMEALVELNPARLIYISCDPPSLSRDIAILANGGYSVNGIKTFDMFPQTSHMEVIASLSK